MKSSASYLHVYWLDHFYLSKKLYLEIGDFAVFCVFIKNTIRQDDLA